MKKAEKISLQQSTRYVAYSRCNTSYQSLRRTNRCVHFDPLDLDKKKKATDIVINFQIEIFLSFSLTTLHHPTWCYMSILATLLGW